MKKYGLRCPIRKANPYRGMLRASQESRTAPYLLNREFREHGPRKVLLTDISYLFFGSGMKSYISTIIDAYTRQVLSFALSKTLEEDFVLETINNLLHDHGISLDTETLINSDQGAHYKSYRFAQILKSAKLRQSMSRKANCWDNSPQESFFGHMKDEIDLSSCRTHGMLLPYLMIGLTIIITTVTNGKSQSYPQMSITNIVRQASILLRIGMNRPKSFQYCTESFVLVLSIKI